MTPSVNFQSESATIIKDLLKDMFDIDDWVFKSISNRVSPAEALIKNPFHAISATPKLRTLSLNRKNTHINFHFPIKSII